jgi:hypothetical protein
MKFQRLEKKPFHIFLLPVFYVLHVINAYYGLFPLRFPLYYIALYLCLSVIVYGLAWLLFRSRGKAAFWSFILLIILLFFGKGHDIMKATPLLKPLSSYKVVLSALIIFMVALTIYVKKKSTAFKKANIYFNLIAIVFVIAEIGHLSFQYIKKGSYPDNTRQEKPILTDLPDIADSSKPDIFFIVFDEYASSASLKKYLNYNNSGLDSMLAKRGFYLAAKSKSNYNSTPYSLSSTFNLNYIGLPLEHTVTVPKVMLTGIHLFSKTTVPKLLENEGYTIKNLGIFDIKGHSAKMGLTSRGGSVKIFYEETIWNRIEREILWNVLLKFPAWFERQYGKSQAEMMQKFTKKFNLIHSELQTQDDRPKFVYGHISIPHPPYYVNRHGELINILLTYNQHSRDSLYLEQLAFCNTWIDSLSKAANRPFKRPRVIIIEGDHGFRDADDEQIIRERHLMNLSTYYFSDKNYEGLYDSITPVNSFRVIFNKYFQTGLPLLKDSSVLLY